MAKFIRQPGPGEMRGEGTWIRIDETQKEQIDTYDYCLQSGFQPVAESVDDLPDIFSVRTRTSSLALHEGHMYHAAGFRIKLADERQSYLKYVEGQLHSLAEAMTNADA